MLTSEASTTSKTPSYVAIRINGVVAYVPAENVPEGAEILTRPLTSAAEVLGEMNKGLVNKIK